MQNYDNISYVFIPFKTNPRCFNMISRQLSDSSRWEEKALELRYFHRFISNKVKGKGSLPSLYF